MSAQPHDLLYYSNYCPHCQNILSVLQKQGLTSKLNCICIDQRFVHPQTGLVTIQCHGKTLPLPPMVHSVPCLLLMSQRGRVLLGDEILTYFQPVVEKQTQAINQGMGEPMSFSFGAALGSSADGFMGLDSYDEFRIPTPPETFKTNKLTEQDMVQTPSTAPSSAASLPKLNHQFFSSL